MFIDPVRGAMVAYDNTGRTVTGTGVGFAPPNEYNPTTDAGYQKNKSVYLASAMKLAGIGGGIEAAAADSWRDTSSDDGQGWIGLRVTLQPGVTREVDVLMAGAVDDFAGATGTYAFKLQNAVQWFYTTNMDAVQSATDAYWSNWVNSGTWVDTPDDRYDTLLKRGLLATALHCDAVNGGVIAGFHNGAYPYVWPRDAVYAAITLARTGHLAEAENVYRWMKEVTFRSFEPWGRKGFWKQKYSTDGYVIWGAPQIDETAVFPWGVWFQYRMTGDPALLNRYVEQVRDAVESCTRTSGADPTRLNLTSAYPGAPAGFPGLMYSNNVWEDSYAPFIYSNANIVRGLRDAASIFDALSLPAERDTANAKAADFTTGLLGRLDWDGENTDVSMLGAVYPFNVISPTDARAQRLIARIDGTRTKFNNTAPSPEPLVNSSGEHAGTVNRYWNDGYWTGGPWFLTTLWYGLFFAERADLTPGKADIDNHKLRTDLMIDRLGPAGLGAEQIAYASGPGASLLYPGQTDFKLQTAWPNAWESMSTFVDSVMAFLDYQPDAPANTVRIAPKLPSAWTTATFHNVTLVNAPAGWTHTLDVAITETPGTGDQTVTLTNRSGNPVNAQVTLKLPVGRSACSVLVNGTPRTYQPSLTGALQVSTFPAATGPMAVTTLVVKTVAGSSPDFNRSGSVELLDIFAFLNAWFAGNPAADFNTQNGVDLLDIFAFLSAWFNGCPA
jgi:GH15 family glucan-1,4-alpha-glucosidase